jgi:predicted ester cyclase
MVSCAPADSSANEEIVLRMIEAVNTRDFDALDEVVSPTVRRYSGATPEVQVTSLEEFKAFLHADLAAVPDAMQETNMIFSFFNDTATTEIYTGTQTGQMGPFPPSGRELELPFIGLLRIEDGKIAEIWVEWDNLNALAQLGHFPPPAMIPEEETPVTE